PQDLSYDGSPTELIIGDDNVFREGVTINRGAPKEDGCTRIGNGNMFMANCHVAHNCHIFNRVILVNGVLLGGHVHVHDGAIVSGNSVVHHFSTLGTLSFVSGGCRVPQDVPPYMSASGSDDPKITTVNVIGMRRAGIPEQTIQTIKRAFRLLFREHRKLDEAKQILSDQQEGLWPIELENLFRFIEAQRRGRFGRAREALRHQESRPSCEPKRRAA
ncbi:MAG TPA: acyl-ACP--UDP-N-acetylglucosamine O-acyltransferase, partial [Planctomycetaceae bacterium]|nr:acyl-ACP--UDP-N-acetylglucosamine O-acyltransferase [Planctomycetaceae bacterium]